MFPFKYLSVFGVPGWLSRSGHDLMGLEIGPHVGLHAQRGVCLGFSPSVLAPTHALSLSLSEINNLKKKIPQSFPD